MRKTKTIKTFFEKVFLYKANNSNFKHYNLFCNSKTSHNTNKCFESKIMNV